MKRVMTISGENLSSAIKVQITVQTDDLTREEVDVALHDLGSKIMRDIESARHVGVYLTQQRIR